MLKGFAPGQEMDSAMRSQTLGAAGLTTMGKALRRNWPLPAAFLALAAVAAALLTGFHERHAKAVIPYPHDLAQVTFAAAGDVIPHEAVRRPPPLPAPASRAGPRSSATSADVFQGADFGFVNWKLRSLPEHSHGSKPFMFDAPLALPQALKASGIKIVSFANNHVMDQGWAGFAETREHLKEVGLVFAGTADNAAQAWQPVITEANGIKVGWLGMTRWLNGNRNPDNPRPAPRQLLPLSRRVGRRARRRRTQVLAAVKAARAQCDLLVVSIHWGIEYATRSPS